MPLLGTLRPIFSMALRKSWRLSAFLMAGREAPMSSTPYFSRTPFSATATAVFRPVWPPRVGRRAQGRSFSMMRATVSGSMGSMYVRSARFGSVMIVAGLELTRTTSYPSSLRALRAWVPE